MVPQMRSTIAQKSDLGRPGVPRDAKGRPEAPGSHFGAFWEPCLAHLGSIIYNQLLGAFLTPTTPHVVMVLVTCLLPAAPPSVLFRPLRHRFSGSAGSRVSAYNC